MKNFHKVLSLLGVLVVVAITTLPNLYLLQTYFLPETRSNASTCNCSKTTDSSSSSISSYSTKEETSTRKPRIAIISSFLPGSQSAMTNFRDFDHLINKACYAKLWGYDFIFNMTYGYDKAKDEIEGKAFWLDYGTWHRVPHIRDRIDDYDWILYADVDYILNDMSRPLESFFKEWELYDKNPSVFIPKDDTDDRYVFSAFVVLIKNDPFGRTILNHWYSFGQGWCPNGNFASEKRAYTWEDSDQPGLWFALAQTHRDFFPESDTMTKSVCNNSTGLVDSARAYGPELNQHFWGVHASQGSGRSELKKVPFDQPILWSLPNIMSNAGIGLQLKWGVDGDTQDLQEMIRHSFAFHHDDVNQWPEHARETLEICKTVHGCFANYTADGMIQIGCDGVNYTVAANGWVKTDY